MLTQIFGYHVFDMVTGSIIGPLLMDASGHCFVLDTKKKEGFAISEYPDAEIRRD
jgi:hypothetical protein